jgi:hypothetical protein
MRPSRIVNTSQTLPAHLLLPNPLEVRPADRHHHPIAVGNDLDGVDLVFASSRAPADPGDHLLAIGAVDLAVDPALLDLRV